MKLAFVGGAPNSAVGYAHFSASRMDGKWDLAAGCFSSHTAANAEAGIAYGVDPGHVYANLEQLLAAEAGKLDAVAVLTPTPLHHQMTIRCLEAGVPVICEKSLAMTSTEAREVESVRAAKNGYLAVIYNYSGYPMVRELRRMIRAGELGEIIHFQVEMPQEGFLRTDQHGNKPAVQGWRRQDGPVPILHLDLGVHLHELVFYLTGLRPLEVVADAGGKGWFPVVDNLNCLCRYEQDVQGQVWFSKTALGYRNGLRLRIFGTKGGAEWVQMNPEELTVSFYDGRRQVFDRGMGLPVASQVRYTRFKAGHPAGFIEALATLYADIHTSLATYKALGHQQSDEVFGADLAVEGLAWLEAIVASCASGRWEKVAR